METQRSRKKKKNLKKKKKKAMGPLLTSNKHHLSSWHLLPPHTHENPHPLSGDCQRSPPVPRRWHGAFPRFGASQGNSPSRAGPYHHHYHVQWQERPGILRSVTFFYYFFQFFLPFFFFLSTSLCFANRIKTLTKISFSEEKHFYRTKTATCFAANTQLKAGK